MRQQRQPCIVEDRVSRLYGHSSASGANHDTQQADPLLTLEQQLQEQGLLSEPRLHQLQQVLIDMKLHLEDESV